MAPPRPQRDGQAPGQDARPGSGRVVFLCHNSQDKAEVRTIADQLDQCGLRPWLDEREMPPGTEWLSELEEQLARTDAGVVFLGPHGLGPWQRQEIPLLLHQSNRRRIPVFAAILASTGPDAEVPGFLANRTLVDLRKAEPDPIEQLIWGITGQRSGTESPPAGPGRLWNIPSRPPHFLPRPDKLETLRSLLLAMRGGTVAITGVVRVGLFGMGGIGKSVLAAWLAEDDQVRRTFVHGIYWLPLGQDPNLPVLQATLADALGEPPSRYASETPAGRLARALANKACLVILDDAWQVSHVKAFTGLGDRGALVVTTRDASLITTLGAAEFSLERLGDQESLRLLANWSEQPVTELAGQEAVVGVIHECGHLPLALAVCGAMARDGVPWPSIHESLRTADLRALYPELPDYEHHTVLKSLHVGVEYLDRAEPDAAQRYLDLAVFPEEEAVPEAAVKTLWAHTGSLPDHLADVLLARLARKSLLGLEGNAPNRRLKLHDLQRDYLRVRGGDVRGLHEALLAGYGSKCPSGWASGPNDGYFLSHLGHHLVAAGRNEESRALLSDFGWLLAKVRAGETAALLTDYGHFPDDEALQLVRGALHRSAQAVAGDSTQLAGQLTGRLLGHSQAEIETLLDQTARDTSGPRLHPLNRCLNPPESPLIYTLEGHGDQVNSVAVSADGRLAASGSQYDGTVRVWDLHTGQCLRTLKGEAKSVGYVSLSPDGRLALIVHGYGIAELWDLQTGTFVQRMLRGHDDWVECVAVSADRRLAVSANQGRARSDSHGRTLRVWDVQTGECRRTLELGAAWVDSIAVSADGGLAVSASHDGGLRVWDLRRGKCLGSLVGHSSQVNSVAVSADGRLAISASQDCALRVWDVPTGACLRTLNGHEAAVNSVAISADGRLAVSGSADTRVLVWDIRTGECLRELNGHADEVSSVAISADGRLAVSGSDDETVRVWDLRSSAGAPTIRGHARSVNSVAVSADGGLTISGSSDQTLRVWDLQTGACVQTLEGHDNEVNSVAISADGRHAVSGSDDRTVRVWDLRTGACVRTLEGHDWGVTAVAVSADPGLALSGCYHGAIQTWDIHSGARQRSLEGHTGHVSSLALSADARRAISGSWDRTVRVWDVQTGACVRTLKAGGASVMSVAVLPDGRIAVCESCDPTFRIWDPKTHHCVRTLKGHAEEVRCVALSADGRLAISASDDRTVGAWDLQSRRRIATFASDARFSACAVTRDGRTVVAGDEFGQVYFLRLENAG